MPTPIFLLVFLGCWFAGKAQTLNPEVLAAAGGSHPVAQIQLDWSLGELAIHPIPYAAGQLTQGFHQPVYGVSRTQELPAFIGRINVFPNPTPDWLAIHWQSEQSRQLRFQLYSVPGAMLWETSANALETTLRYSLGDLPAGPYVLHILVDGGRYFQTITIQKVN